VKPIPIDGLETKCSAGDMKATSIASYLRASAFPFAFLVAPALTQGGCTGTDHHAQPPPPPPQEEEEDEDPGGMDLYEMMCDYERHRGDKCPSKVDWCASMGKRPVRWGCK